MKWIVRHQRLITRVYLSVGILFAVSFGVAIACSVLSYRPEIHRLRPAGMSKRDLDEWLAFLGVGAGLSGIVLFIVLVLASSLVRNNVVLTIGGLLILAVAGLLLAGALRI